MVKPTHPWAELTLAGASTSRYQDLVSPSLGKQASSSKSSSPTNTQTTNGVCKPASKLRVNLTNLIKLHRKHLCLLVMWSLPMVLVFDQCLPSGLIKGICPHEDHFPLVTHSSISFRAVSWHGNSNCFGPLRCTTTPAGKPDQTSLQVQVQNQLAMSLKAWYGDSHEHEHGDGP